MAHTAALWQPSPSPGGADVTQGGHQGLIQQFGDSVTHLPTSDVALVGGPGLSSRSDATIRVSATKWTFELYFFTILSTFESNDSTNAFRCLGDRRAAAVQHWLATITDHLYSTLADCING